MQSPFFFLLQRKITAPGVVLLSIEESRRIPGDLHRMFTFKLNLLDGEQVLALLVVLECL
jgi:hypothetical protein